MRRLGGTTVGGRGATAAAAVSAVLVLALGACGNDADGAAGDGPSAPESSSASPAETPTESASVAEPTPTPEPATGPRLDVSDVRVNAPEGWKQTFSSVVVDTAQGRTGRLNAGLVLSVAATGGDQLSLRQAERYFWLPGEKPPNFERQDTTVMGGITAGYYTARDAYDDIHAVTTWDANHVVKVQMGFDRRLPEKRQQEILQSVLASYSSPRTR